MSDQTLPYRIESRGPNLFIRAIYSVFIGWWLGALVSAVAWFLIATIIGLPLGLWLINRLPTLITLRPQEQSWRLEGGVLARARPSTRSCCAPSTSS